MKKYLRSAKCAPTQEFSITQLNEHHVEHHAQELASSQAQSQDESTETENEATETEEDLTETEDERESNKHKAQKNPITQKSSTSSDIPNQPTTLVVSAGSSKKRSHDEDVLSAFQIADESERCKRIVLSTAASYDLSPFMVKDCKGNEFVALAHSSVVAKLQEETVRIAIATTEPKPASSENTSCSSLPCAAELDIASVIANSPYASALRTREFMEVDSSIWEVLNSDFQTRLQLRYACAQILAGSVLLNTSNGQAVIANTVEIYGLKEPMDSHPLPLFRPPRVMKTRYNDVWPGTIMDKEGPRLVIACEQFTLLVTSSLRLDCPTQGSVGSATPTFVLPTAQDSLATRIYIDKASLDLGLKIVAQERGWCISETHDMAGQIRHLTKKFWSPSAFFFCRASGHITRNTLHQPLTVHTLWFTDDLQMGDVYHTAMFLHDISVNIAKNQSRAILDLSTVTRYSDQLPARGSKAAKEFRKILALFHPFEGYIRIIGNYEVSEALENLAKLLLPAIDRANAAVLTRIFEAFSLNNAS
ncbi:hypothetical protein BGX28_003019 [Mortierella sp. GBA30]|nr:hypothetical protein BGX28_003019 [Mortierella sp. GBA30]